MSVSSSCDNPHEWTYTGPEDPLTKVGEREEVGQNFFGELVVSQSYEDGTIYQLQVRSGAKFNPDQSMFRNVPDARWMGVFQEGGSLYVSFWVGNENN